MHLRVRCYAHEVGTEASVKAKYTFLLGHFHKAVQHTSIPYRPVGSFLLRLESRLDKVEREAEKCREEAGDARGGNSLRLN